MDENEVKEGFSDWLNAVMKGPDALPIYGIYDDYKITFKMMADFPLKFRTPEVLLNIVNALAKARTDKT